jgi:hypothetical protein
LIALLVRNSLEKITAISKRSTLHFYWFKPHGLNQSLFILITPSPTNNDLMSYSSFRHQTIFTMPLIPTAMKFKNTVFLAINPRFRVVRRVFVLNRIALYPEPAAACHANQPG